MKAAVVNTWGEAPAGELQLRTLAQPLADVERAWTSAEPSGTRVVLTP